MARVLLEIPDRVKDNMPGGRKYESIEEWDSIGHMGLIAELEDSFEISMEMDDIIDFSSYVKGKEILKKYDIDV